MKNSNDKSGIRIILKVKEKITLKDSLSITLTSFSHKADLNGHVMMGTAHITLSKDAVTEKKIISALTDEAKPPMEQNEYDILFWRAYEIQLKNLIYDKSIELLIFKGL